MSGARIKVSARPVSVVLAQLFAHGLMFRHSLLRMREPEVIEPGSAFFAVRKAERDTFMARVHHQLGQEVAAEAEAGTAVEGVPA